MMKFALKQAQKWDMMESNANTGIHLLIFFGKSPLQSQNKGSRQEISQTQTAKYTG